MKADDSSLTPEQLRAVELKAHNLLDRASGWGRYPTPVDDILGAAKLKVADKQAFDTAGVLAFIANKTKKVADQTANLVMSALSKVFGIYDAAEEIIHIDQSVTGSKQTFLTLHETGHHELPTHKKLFRFFQDCEKTLSPDVSELFEREANNFARFALFQGDGFKTLAADSEMTIKAAMKVGGKFGASVYASVREFTRTNHRDCLAIILNPIEYCDGAGARAAVRRIEPSPSYRLRFPVPVVDYITLNDPFGRMLPIGSRRVIKPTQMRITDRNGQIHDALAEAFNTTHNIIILLYPVKALTATTVIMPPGFKQAVNS